MKNQFYSSQANCFTNQASDIIITIDINKVNDFSSNKI